MKLYAITRTDGGVSIMSFDGDDVESEIAKWPDDDRAAVTGVAEIDAIPADPTFRQSWVFNEGAVVVDMPRAREQHRDHLRRMRKPLLEALDLEYMRADEAGDARKKSEVAARKKALRDLTALSAIDSAKTPEMLKAIVV